MSLGVAFRAFFAALFNSEAAVRIGQALDGPSQDGPTLDGPVPAERSSPQIPQKTPGPAGLGVEVESKAAAGPKGSARSDALTLLATLQREARLLDLIQEPLDQFSDQQIGAAAREVLKDSQQTLKRMFAIQPLSDVEEGGKMTIASEASPNRQRLIGKSSGSSGAVAHRGWQATTCDVPQWNGKRDDAMILAPIEIEVD